MAFAESIRERERRKGKIVQENIEINKNIKTSLK